jgi:ankyrin repeat protein
MKQFKGYDIVCYTDDEVRNALEDGFDPNTFMGANSVLNITPLIQSVLFNRLSVFKLLIKYGADPNKTDDHGDTVLHYACVHDQVDFVCFILSYGCVVDSFNKNRYTPLRYVIFLHGYNDCIVPLLDAGAKISNVKDTQIPDSITNFVQKRNQLKRRIVLFLALSKKTKAVHKDLLNPISKMVWKLRDTIDEEEEKIPSKKKSK